MNRRVSVLTERTHEGAPAPRLTPLQALRRSVLTCLLWESGFYEDGVEIATRIHELAQQVSPVDVALLASETRSRGNLRHAPLWLSLTLAGKPILESVLADIIQRPDELTEWLALYWKDGRRPIPAAAKRGLARAFCKFDAYRLAKYNRDGIVKLRDVLRLVHPKPRDAEQSALWKSLLDGTLEPADTWERALSAGADKRATWVRLLREEALGALALLRNLRNMVQVGVPGEYIRAGLASMRTERVLPYRFIAAARAVPDLEPELEAAMFRALQEAPKLAGRTVLLVDVSGSMDTGQISGKSDLRAIDAACGLAMLLREVCREVRVFTFSDQTVAVPPRRGFALRDAVVGSQRHRSTDLGGAVEFVNQLDGWDRLIVLTDEQSHTRVPGPARLGYLINVAANRNGVGYGSWVHLDGFSEAVVDWIIERERTVP